MMIAGTQGQDQQIQLTKTSNWRKSLLITTSMVVIGYFAFPIMANWYSDVRSIERSSLLTAQVFGGVLVRDIAVSGKLVAANAPQLYSTERGKITILFKPGTEVAQGEIVATVKSPTLAALIEQQKSVLDGFKTETSRGELADGEARLDLERSLDGAKVKLNAAKRESDRAKQSFAKQVISQLDFVISEDTLLEAQLQHRYALKKVALTKKRLAFEQQTRQQAVERQKLVVAELSRRQYELDIRSPVSGIVGNWSVKQKQLVTNSESILTVVDLSNYEAELNVPEFYADDLGIGLAVSMTIAGNKLAGEISSVSPEVNNSQVKVRVKIILNSAIKLRQNQRLNARIEFERKPNVLMVKRGRFLQSTAGKSAFIINDNFATRHDIVTGSSSVEFVEIVSGAVAGDVLVISDYENFNQVNTIKIVN